MPLVVQKPVSSSFKDLERGKFGRWRVVSYAGSNNGTGARWKCKCKCGIVRVVSATTLQQGLSKSCGCLQRESAVVTAKTLHLRRRKFESPNKTHGLSGSPEYRAWNQMIQRCTNPNLRNYADYGGRGVKVFGKWMSSFESFYKYVGPRPSPEHSIDRFPNNDGNYEPGNVRWTTDSQQRFNSRHPRKFVYKGKLRSMKAISRLSQVPYATLRRRLSVLGWSIDNALSVPIMGGK